MDLEKIGSNIIKAFGVLAALVGIIIALFLGLFIGALVMGVIFGVVLGGSIDVDTSTNATLSNIQGNFSSTIGQVTSGANIAGSLIPVAIVLIVFAGFVVLGVYGYKKYKESKEGGMGGY